MCKYWFRLCSAEMAQELGKNCHDVKNILLRNISPGTHLLRQLCLQEVISSDTILAFQIKQVLLSLFTAQEVLI